MSRVNVAKGKNEKGGKAGASAPTPHQAVDIIPGKFTDLDWYYLLDRDDSDEFCSEIVDQICDDALGIIFNKYLERQLIPFSVEKAKNAIIHIIQWQFLEGDAGETKVSTDIGWQEDEEPEPCTTDCWAQGSVPRKIVTPRSESILEQVVEETTEDLEQAAVTLAPVSEENTMELETPTGPPMGGIQHERTIIEDDTSLVIEGAPIAIQPSPPQPTQEEKKASRKKFKPYTGKLKSAGVSRMTESLHDREMKKMEEDFMQTYQDFGEPVTPDKEALLMPNSMQSVIKLQAGRPPGNRDVVFDQYGTVLSMSKINPVKLPSHSIPVQFTVLEDAPAAPLKETKWKRVHTKFKIVDPDVEAAKARLEAMRTGKYIKSSWKPVPKSVSAKKDTGSLKITRSPLPPPMIEAMEVAPGVVVRENERMKKGLKYRHEEMDYIETALINGLRPVKFKNTSAVPPVLASSVPIIKPLTMTPPVPPISQQH